jgi:hypothetical protein
MTPIAIGGMCWAAVGVLVCFWARQKSRAHRAFVASAIRARGRVVALGGEDGDVATVEFLDTQGRAHRIEGRMNTSHRVGDDSTVYYEPERPRDARLAEDLTNATLATGVVGVVFTLAGLAVAVLGLTLA